MTRRCSHITDVNRPGLQFHSFYDYFDPRRLQVLGKAGDHLSQGVDDGSSGASASTTCFFTTSRPW